LLAAFVAMVAGPAVAASALVFTKTPDGSPSINPGDTATFTYTLTNNAAANAEGENDAIFPQLTDFLPTAGGIVWSVDSVTGGTCNPIDASTFAPDYAYLSCDFDTIFGDGAQASVVVSGTPTSCANPTLTSIAVVSSHDSAGPLSLPDPGTINVLCSRPLFVIGDVEPHGVGADVYFWGSQWWKKNEMSGYVANGTATFKGYATDSDPDCGGTWVSRTGNSSNPPDSIAGPVLVIVTDTIGKQGPDISGTIKQILVVEPAGGFGPAPGHKDHGIVTGINCTAQQP
jgi:hypothetical protein